MRTGSLYGKAYLKDDKGRFVAVDMIYNDGHNIRVRLCERWGRVRAGREVRVPKDEIFLGMRGDVG